MKLSPDKVAALKVATKLLISKLGTLEAAASVCRVSLPVLSEYQSLDRPERLMPIDVVLQLEEVAGEAIVTGAMARMQGYTLARTEAGTLPEIGRAVAAAARAGGAATAAFMEAQVDGVLDAGERAGLVRHYEAVRDHAEAALAGLTVTPKLAVVA